VGSFTDGERHALAAGLARCQQDAQDAALAGGVPDDVDAARRRMLVELQPCVERLLKAARGIPTRVAAVAAGKAPPPSLLQ
jgi:hypothetical protein